MNLLICDLKRGKRPSLSQFIEAFGPAFGLLFELEKTVQDAEWHAEGNVFIHTQYVLEEIYKLLDLEASYLTFDQKICLILAAIFHDIGKPLVSRSAEIDGSLRIIAPRHEERGCSYLAYKLLDLNISYPIVQQVLRLVAYHHKPRRLVLHNAPKNEYFHLARLVNLELLFYLAKADILGRICKDQHSQCDYIDLFRLFCEEYQLWGKENPYEDWQHFFNQELAHLPAESRDAVLGYAIQDFEQGLIFTPQEAIARRYPYLKSFPQLVMTCGPSGSGKSTWIENHLVDYQKISLDDLREQYSKTRKNQAHNRFIFAKAKEQLKDYLRHHDKVVWDATNLRKDFRNIISQLAYNYHALVTLVVLHIPEILIQQGNQSRSGQIPQQVLQGQMDALEWVETCEAHRVVFVNHEKCLNIQGTCEPFSLVF